MYKKFKNLNITLDDSNNRQNLTIGNLKNVKNSLNKKADNKTKMENVLVNFLNFFKRRKTIISHFNSRVFKRDDEEPIWFQLRCYC